MTELETLDDRMNALEMIVEELLPRLIAASSIRDDLEAQLRAVAEEQTTPEEDRDLHYRAELARTILETLEAL